MGVGILSGTKVLVGDSDTKSQLKQRGFGEEEEKTYILSLIEALFLVEEGKFDVMKKDKKLSFGELVKLGSRKEKEFYNKYIVYRDLRKRGMVVRTGLKFGTDFRLYERGSNVGGSHSKYLVHVVPEEYTCSFPEMARALRLAKNVNKDMIYAIVDEEGDVTYYLVDRMRL
jgi:tRNA-intron endonuclease